MYVTISPDRMKLFLSKEESIKGFLCELLDEDSIDFWLEGLSSLGVPFGAIDQERLKDLHNFEVKPEGKHLIAEGAKPTNEGVEVVFNFEFMNPPVKDEDSKADYYSLGYGVDVMEGQLLAEQTVLGPGKDGYEVLGKRLPHVVFADQPQLMFNQNVIVEKEGLKSKFFSKINGVLHNNSKKELNVYEVFEIKGAVGFETGNINTSQDVQVMGDVKAGFSIRSGANVYIKGVVEKNATIEAGKVITIEGGIAPGVKITSKGDVHLKFAQGARIESQANIHVSSYLYDCYAFAQKAFYCAGPGGVGRGAVIGGTINAIELIELLSVGSNNARTTLVAGFDYAKNEEYKELVELKESLATEVKRQARLLPVDLLDPNFKAVLKALPESEKKICRQRIQQIITNRKECEILGTRISELGPNAIEYFFDAKVIVKKSLFPDVNIVLCDDYKLICRDSDAVVFSVKKGRMSSSLEPET